MAIADTDDMRTTIDTLDELSKRISKTVECLDAGRYVEAQGWFDCADTFNAAQDKLGLLAAGEVNQLVGPHAFEVEGDC
jgi:hypothetical protein